MKLDPILFVDGYKVGHKFQYAPGTTFVYSNLTARSNRLAKTLPKYLSDEILWVGLSGVLQDLTARFDEGFFKLPKQQVLAKYKRRMDAYLGPDSVDTSHIADLHDLGYLPVMILAIPEGNLVPVKVPVLTIENTHENFAWVVNMLETILSSMLWQFTTNATMAFQYRCLLEDYAVKTGSPVDFVQWQGHDFSFRGMPGVEAAAMSGAGHLFNFLGTDTLPAIDYLEEYYKGIETYVGGSVPASEHSVASTNIISLLDKHKDATNPMLEAEKEFFLRYITEIYPTGVASYVSDTYDFWGVLTEIAPACKDAIMNRKPNHIGLNKVVFRPDSGDPVKILTGYDVIGEFTTDDEYYAAFDYHSSTFTLDHFHTYSAVKIGEKYYKAGMHDYSRVAYGPELSEAEVKGAVETLWDTFGGTITSEGYKLLDQHVGLIYGDSITLDRAEAILSRLAAKGFASANVVFGIGSYTYQYNTRDTHGFAIKTTACEVDHKILEIFKDPKTDNGTKKSAKGFLSVNETEDGSYTLKDQVSISEMGNAFKQVYFNGEVQIAPSLAEVRTNVNKAVQRKIA